MYRQKRFPFPRVRYFIRKQVQLIFTNGFGHHELSAFLFMTSFKRKAGAAALLHPVRGNLLRSRNRAGDWHSQSKS
jgi:hypothetical protein